VNYRRKARQNIPMSYCAFGLYERVRPWETGLVFECHADEVLLATPVEIDEELGEKRVLKIIESKTV